jgi:hypothetical protein
MILATLCHIKHNGRTLMVHRHNPPCSSSFIPDKFPQQSSKLRRPQLQVK